MNSIHCKTSRLNAFVRRVIVTWLAILCLSAPLLAQQSSPDRPNILWLSTEDIGPQLGCYGDPVARTPNLDRLAGRGMVFDFAWSNYPVCAPARTTIVTGMYAVANGAGHMRCNRPLPEGVAMFPQLLQQAGYVCTNQKKEDYNHPKPGKVWDKPGKQSPFGNSVQAGSQGKAKKAPFFAVINHTGTHESRIRKRPHQAVTDPALVQLASYWPDRPEVREDWAQYYDNIATMDQWVGRQLAQLEQSGEADNTIIVFFGDHGSGMPRHKRYAGDSGMRVPMIVYFPERYRHLAPTGYAPGQHSKQLVGFIDLAPTTLSLAGIQPPEYMQGGAFAGVYPQPPAKFLYGFRERMDERPDLSRSLRDERYLYVRNYMPHLPAGQHVDYQMQTPTTRLWREMYDAGQLNAIQCQFWEARSAEEFYDLEKDPDETVNLIDDPSYQSEIERFREAHRRKTMEIRDPGFIPESMLQQIAHQPGQVAGFCADPQRYPIEQVFEMANLAAQTEGPIPSALRDCLHADNPVLRYWLAMAFLARGADACRNYPVLLVQLRHDPNINVAITAAEALALYGTGDRRQKAIDFLVQHSNIDEAGFYVAVTALNGLDRLPEDVALPLAKIEKFPRKTDQIQRGGDYVQRLIERVGNRAGSQ
ncbi:MAG: sulfatase [Mariniblastus sp.]|nr:sulfatase [Mariniblastus sp.]